jgi:hypothetical protein
MASIRQIQYRELAALALKISFGPFKTTVQKPKSPQRSDALMAKPNKQMDPIFA